MSLQVKKPIFSEKMMMDSGKYMDGNWMNHLNWRNNSGYRPFEKE
jgi:hypothetical protein